MTTVTSNKWPNGARTAVALTLDNMGEAADLNRGLWPEAQPIGSHYSVTEALPKILALLEEHNIHVTYFIESWNLTQYGSTIADKVAACGHEVAWHAWQHEAWNKLSEVEERNNFERSFGDDGLEGFISGSGKGRGKVLPYRGFRPPGGIIHGQRTLRLCQEFGLGYISPAAEKAAVVEVAPGALTPDLIVILPFRWRTVDAYYYMESFAALRKLKGDAEATMSENELAKRYISEIDKAIEAGQFLSLLFHPFLTSTQPRLDAMETVVAYLAQKRNEGAIWLAKCRDIEYHVRKYPRSVSDDPEWDTSTWR